MSAIKRRQILNFCRLRFGFKIDAAGAMAKLLQGETLELGSYSLVTVSKLECGDERYAWLNDVITVGIGEQSGFNPVYTIYEIG